VLPGSERNNILHWGGRHMLRYHLLRIDPDLLCRHIRTKLLWEWRHMLRQLRLLNGSVLLFSPEWGKILQ